jgi:alanine-glyoxylate transaminase/serine-glyoxylate transaminase/serine-pyruvate transaminase
MTLSLEPCLLLGPGPSPISQKVLDAISQPTLGHLDHQFSTMMAEIIKLQQYIFQTKTAVSFPISGPGSAGMECCLFNMIEPGEKMIVCVNGVFGARMREISERVGARVVLLEQPFGEAVDLEELQKLLETHPDTRCIAAVHAETSTGVLSDIEAIARLAKKYGCYTIIDAVTSIGGVPFYMDDWGVDAVYTGSQKCLSVPPGLSPVAFSRRAIEKIKSRRQKVLSWFYDVNEVLRYWSNSHATSKRTYHHTAPVNALYGLYQGLLNLSEEGLECAWQRHLGCHLFLEEKLTELNLELIVPKAIRLPQINVVKVPEHINAQAVRERLRQDFSIEVGDGLGEYAGKVWRIGLMGEGARIEHARQLIEALTIIFKEGEFYVS